MSNRIIQITACTTRGDKRDFANVYGLDEASKVYQWDPSEGRWRPFKLEAKRSRGGRDDAPGF